MEQKTSAHYQRLHRQRLREQGLVKKEVWILPEYGAALQQLEKQMRMPGLQPESMGLIHKEGGMDNSRQAYRDIHALAGDLQQSALVQAGRLHIEVLEGADASVLVSLPEFGDLPVHVALSGDQLVVEAFLWPADQVHDRAGLNEQMLRLQKLFPFTTMALEPQAHGGEGYVMFAALHASSSEGEIIAEILTLADSVIQATEALAHYLAPVPASTSAPLQA
jgi:uncharacterized protein YjfI (DUF2170 family)